MVLFRINDGFTDIPMTISELPPYVLFYDGDCGVCAASVDFVLKREKRPLLHFAAQDSELGKRILAGRDLGKWGTIVLTENGKFYRKSDAAFRVMKLMGGIWSFVGSVGLLIPRPVRDFGYDLAAKHRKKVLRNRACKIYGPKERLRFLA